MASKALLTWSRRKINPSNPIVKDHDSRLPIVPSTTLCKRSGPVFWYYEEIDPFSASVGSSAGRISWRPTAVRYQLRAESCYPTQQMLLALALGASRIMINVPEEMQDLSRVTQLVERQKHLMGCSLLVSFKFKFCMMSESTVTRRWVLMANHNFVLYCWANKQKARRTWSSYFRVRVN